MLGAARTAKTGWFGDNKVFISHVWRALGEPNAWASHDGPDLLADFKARLVEAHQARLLSLSRADLVEAMPREDVAASETRYRRATFHFVRVA